LRDRRITAPCPVREGIDAFIGVYNPTAHPFGGLEESRTKSP
jgi:hypothetical protein